MKSRLQLPPKSSREDEPLLCARTGDSIEIDENDGQLTFREDGEVATGSLFGIFFGKRRHPLLRREHLPPRPVFRLATCGIWPPAFTLSSTFFRPVAIDQYPALLFHLTVRRPDSKIALIVRAHVHIVRRQSALTNCAAARSK